MRVLLALMLIPLALAQAAEPISIEADMTSVIAAAAEPGIVSLTISRPGTTGSPADDPLAPLFGVGEGDVTVTVSGVPEGWQIGLDPSGFPLAPGESREVTATITVSPETDVDTADLVFTATLETPDPSGVFVAGGQASIAVTAVHDEGATRDLLEAIGPGIWAVLGALLVSIIVAVYLAVDAKTKVVLMGAPTAEFKLRPGATATVPFWVENKSREADRFSLNANPADPEWRGKLETRGVTLQSGQRQELEFSITAPKTAKPGSRALVRVITVPDHSPRRIGVLAVTIKVE